MGDDLFQRQRRNLVLMSSLVLFVNITGGEITKIRLLGNELILRNPSTLPLLLAIVLAYFFLRFAQYAHEVENKGFRDRFFKRIELYLGPYLLKREFYNPKADLRRNYPNIADIEIEGPVTMFHKAMPENTAAVTFVGKQGGAVIDYSDLHVAKRELIWPYVRAGFYICVRTRLVTDYVLPVFLTIAAFASFIKEFPTLWTFAP